jgi:hypothetical protein
MSGALTGSCHCGAVRVTIPHRPDTVNACNCTVCTKLGWRCCYFRADEATVNDAPLDRYVRADITEPALAVMRCRNCGIATHWVPLDPAKVDRMGVNIALFDPAVFEGVEMCAVDGRSWPL